MAEQWNRWREGRNAAFQEEIMDDDAEDQFAHDLVQQNMEFVAEMEDPTRHGGSRHGRAANLNRQRQLYVDHLYNDYFVDDPVYPVYPHFRRRYQMSKSLFLHIMHSVAEYDNYFVQKRDALGVEGLTSYQKCTAVLRLLAYGTTVDATDEYCRIGESTTLECLKRFVLAVRACFEVEFLRQPTRSDIQKQMEINEARGFPGMFGSIDCIHYRWKNCPTAWAWQFQNKDGNKSIILEAIADQSTWIWHAYFGLPGGNNDINVLDRSPFVADLLRSNSNDFSFTVNGHLYPRYYLLADGIYPKWSCFIQTIHEPEDEKKRLFARKQEAARKDVERAFGVLQARWGIIQNPSRSWSMETIDNIMTACVIMHNMIIQDEQDEDDLEEILDFGNVPHIQRGLTFDNYVQGTMEIENFDTFYRLRHDLIEHLWQVEGQSRRY